MTVVFDATLYSKEAIQQAIKDYESIAQINLSIQPEQYICSIEKASFPEEQTSLEFSNYVLALTVSTSEKKL